MKKLISLLFIISFIQIGFAQSSDNSKNLLDEVSNKIASYQNIMITFDYNLDNDKERVHQKTSGNVLIQGDKYHLEFMGIEKIFDGKKVSTIVHEDEEVVISNPSNDDNDFTPNKILSFYKKGYNYSWDKSAVIEGKKIQYIKLIPIKTGDVSYIMLGVDYQNKQIFQVEYVDKKNTKTAFKIRSFKPNTEISPKEFIFDEAKYKAKNYSVTKM